MKHIAQTEVVRQIEMRHFKARAILSHAKVFHKETDFFILYFPCDSKNQIIDGN